MKYPFYFLMLLLIITPAYAQVSGKAEIVVQNGHGAPIKKMCFSQNGKWVVSAGDDRVVKLWDAATGKEIRSFKGHAMSVNGVAISPDGKYIASCSSSEKVLKLWDILTGNEVWSVESGQYLQDIEFSPDSRTIYLAGESSYLAYDVETSKTRTLGGGKLAAIDLSQDGKYLATGGWDNALQVFDTEKNVSLFYKANAHTKTLFDLAVSADNRSVITCGLDGSIRFFDLLTGKLIKTLGGGANREYFSVDISSDGKYLVSGDKTGARLWDLQSMTEKKFFYHDGSSEVTCVKFSPDNKTFITSSYATTRINMFDVQSGKRIRTFFGNGSGIDEFAISKGFIYTRNNNNTIKAWNMEELLFSKVYRTKSGRVIKSLSVSPDNSWLATLETDTITNHKSRINFKDVISGDTLNTFNRFPSKTKYQPHPRWVNVTPTGKVFIGYLSGDVVEWNKSYSGQFRHLLAFDNSFIESATKVIKYSPDSRWALMGAANGIIKIYNLEKGKVAKSFTADADVQQVGLSPDATSFVAYTNKGFWYGDILKGKELINLGQVSSGISYLEYSPDGKFVAIGDYTGKIKLMDVASKKVVKEFIGHSNNIKGLQFSGDGKFLTSASADGMITHWNVEQGNRTSLASSNDGKQWIIFTDDGYWDASTNGGDLVAMVQGLEVYNIDQFAVKNNRPDIILQRIGSSNKELIDHYQRQYQRRLRRLNITEQQLTADVHVPVSIIKNVKQDGKFATIQFELSDTRFNLKGYNVFVNDVPLFGAYGKTVNGKNQVLTEMVELTSGENKIEISCMNENGSESYRALTDINYTKEVKGDLYVLSFGVSNYSDATLNLQFADKDAQDVVNTFAKMEGKGYNKAYVKTYVNEQVTPETIKAAKAFVNSAKPDDTFILFIAGHGMHDNDRDATYYYLTHGTDVNNLKGTAADFDLIEDLLQAIPPRKKLFFMDTCESGEKEEKDENTTSELAQAKGIKSRGMKPSVAKSKTAGDEPKTYLAQKSRFIYNDLVRRSGAIVFSSSQGSEYSYESAEIQNGFFTKEIISALSNRAADKDNDQKISTDELREYVSKTVSQKTGGLQNPTVDRDNIYLKFGFSLLE